METKHLIAKDKFLNESIKKAAILLKKGEIVAIPTETVYGLGADATREEAVDKIYRAKGRPNDNPLIVHIGSKEQLFELVTDIPPYVEDLIDKFSPGPITYVLKSSGKVAKNVTAGLTTVGVRIPDNPVALELLRYSEIPIAAPSANISGKPSPTTAQHVLDDLEGKISAVLDGGPAKVGVESTVIDCTEAQPVVLRLGKITTDEIQQVVGNVEVASTLSDNSEKPKSPGMKYKHYAPEVPLILVKQKSQMEQVINKEKSKGSRIGLLISASNAKQFQAEKIIVLGENEEEIAERLYNALRSFKQEEIDVVICESFPTSGVGRAVMDRIERAATSIID